MTQPTRGMKQLLIYSTCALTLGAMSGAANANMCMKHPYGYHAYKKPMYGYGMHRHARPMPSYAYPPTQYEQRLPEQPAVKSAAVEKQLQKTGAGAQTAPAPARGPDIVETAAAAGTFKTLIKAVLAADLYDTLRGDGPFTVFAPTDAAFEKLPAGTLAGLLADKEKLAAVLTYHVLPGRITAADILQRRDFETVQGQTLSIDALSVVSADIETSNGIVHVIDNVLIPVL